MSIASSSSVTVRISVSSGDVWPFANSSARFIAPDMTSLMKALRMRSQPAPSRAPQRCMRVA